MTLARFLVWWCRSPPRAVRCGLVRSASLCHCVGHYCGGLGRSVVRSGGGSYCEGGVGVFVNCSVRSCGGSSCGWFGCVCSGVVRSGGGSSFVLVWWCLRSGRSAVVSPLGAGYVRVCLRWYGPFVERVWFNACGSLVVCGPFWFLCGGVSSCSPFVCPPFGCVSSGRYGCLAVQLCGVVAGGYSMNCCCLSWVTRRVLNSLFEGRVSWGCVERLVGVCR